MTLREQLLQASKLVKKDCADFKISVVMPVLNEVDADNTKASFLEAGADEVLQIEGSIGTAAARNQGANQAIGDVVVFTDAHVRWEKGSLARFANLAYNNLAMVVAPCSSIDNPSHFTAYGGELIPHKRYPGYNIRTPCLRVTEADALWGSVYAVSKSTWRYLGGWPPTIGWGYNEQALTLLCKVRDVKILVDSECRILHKFRTKEEQPYIVDQDQKLANHVRVHYALSTEEEWNTTWYPAFKKHPLTRFDLVDFNKPIGWLRETMRCIIKQDGSLHFPQGSNTTPKYFKRKDRYTFEPIEIDCQNRYKETIKLCCGKTRTRTMCKKLCTTITKGNCLKCRYPEAYKELS
jgi:glycosyltransferase involved in cell wall biosynthesis